MKSEPQSISTIQYDTEHCTNSQSNNDKSATEPLSMNMGQIFWNQSTRSQRGIYYIVVYECGQGIPYAGLQVVRQSEVKS